MADQITTMINAIHSVEGLASGDRAQRNNNPGNLKPPNGETNFWNGQTGVDSDGFAIFSDTAAGTAALRTDLTTHIRENPNQTITQFMASYSPDQTGESGEYGAKVASSLGLSPDTPLKDVANIPATASAADSSSVEPLSSPTALVAQRLSGETVNQETINQAQDPTLVITKGLDNTPWYSDPDLVITNGQLKYNGVVVFEIILPLSGKLLSDSKSSPIKIKLNASLTHIDMSSGHIIHKTPSRTGYHVTFWGQQADSLSGSASTGVFMNRLGLTQLMSLSSIPSDLEDKLTNAFKDSQSPYNSQGSLNGALRVAAQDAFVELLHLFKMNSVYYFTNSSYNGTLNSAQQEQQGSTAWSPVEGTSTFQANSRVNDVIARGNVVMYLRNEAYLGYFKSFSWVMDADQPFQWNIDFIFQVEKIITKIFYAQPNFSSLDSGVRV